MSDGFPTIFPASWWNAFSDAQLDAFLGAIKDSPLLSSMITAFQQQGGKVVVGSVNGGTLYDTGTKTITVDAGWLPNGCKAQSPLALADVLAHELGHALLNDSTSLLLAANPDAAAAVSAKNEGQTRT
jgi:hypothetical protein